MKSISNEEADTMDTPNFRLSDVIALNVDKDKISSILQLVADAEDMDSEQRMHSLVLSGVALGVEETLARMREHDKESLEFLPIVLTKIDTALDESKSTETSVALASLRTVIAERFAKVLETLRAAFASRMYMSLGVGQELIFSDTEPADYQRVDLIAVGAEVYRRMPSAVLGWHYGRTQGYPPKFNCKCPQCHVELFDNGRVSQEIGLRQMVTDSDGMDNAMADYAVFLLTELRAEVDKMARSVPSLHSIDPQESEDQYKSVMERVRKGAV